MKNFLFFILFLICAGKAFCQPNYPYEEITLARPSDYRAAEPLALSASTFLLSTAFKQKDIARTHAMDFLIKWMEGSKDYSFNLSGVGRDLAEDRDLFGLYGAAMVKFTLENKNVSANPRMLEVGARKMVLDYCNEPSNNFKLRKKMRKLLETD